MGRNPPNDRQRRKAGSGPQGPQPAQWPTTQKGGFRLAWAATRPTTDNAERRVANLPDDQERNKGGFGTRPYKY